MGEARILVREPVSLGLRRDQLDEGPEIVGEDAHHHHGHESGVDGNRQEHVVLTGDAAEQKDTHHDAGHEKGRDRQMGETEDAGDHRDRHEDRHMALLIRAAVAVQDHRPTDERDRKDCRQNRRLTKLDGSLLLAHLVDAHTPPPDRAQHANSDQNTGKSESQEDWRQWIMRYSERTAINGQQDMKSWDVLPQFRQLANACGDFRVMDPHQI